MSTAAETLLCPAKINLFLEVHDKRPDGYHGLGTLFNTVNVGDTLSAEPWDALELVCPENITAIPDDNLVLKAARLLLKTYSHRLPPETGVRFVLEKKLPTGAGLGGGSSDAASALLLCNRLWKLDLRIDELLPVAAALGADVPFFLYSGSFFGEGKGEILSPAPSPYPFHIVIGTPHCKVETGWAYGQLPPGRKRQWDKFKALYFTYCEEWEFYQALRNDFDDPMRRHFPAIRELAQLMNTFSPVKTMLCGSGASVLALFRGLEPAQNCLAAIEASCRFSCLTEFAS